METAAGEGLGVTTNGETNSLLVAVSGSSSGVQYYRLANPPGIVVILPHGRPRTPSGSHPVGGAFRRVIVGHRSTGYVVRIYFATDQVPEVLAEATGVRVTLRPRRNRQG